MVRAEEAWKWRTVLTEMSKKSGEEQHQLGPGPALARVSDYPVDEPGYKLNEVPSNTYFCSVLLVWQNIFCSVYYNKTKCNKYQKGNIFGLFVISNPDAINYFVWFVLHQILTFYVITKNIARPPSVNIL